MKTRDITGIRVPASVARAPVIITVATAEIMTCLGMSGISKAYGYDWGNVYTDDLHHILRDGEMMELFRLSIGEMKDRSPVCRECEWKKLCVFGCRAEACAQGNTIEGIDQRMCIFFKDGYYDRFRAIAKKYDLET